MSFVSYAQNFEDVMLWRALKSVEKGFYVDVGAQHPVFDSVSKAFYERGWRGIHIEPVPEFAELLRQDRPDETVLQIALGDTDGTIEFCAIGGTGLSTAVAAHAERHHVERGLTSEQIQVPVLRMKSALKALHGKEVHWLKIDVEGFEGKVLKGWDSRALRPWIMVIEATLPNSSELDFSGWEPIVTGANYQFAYFDGLNRFYVANEHAELAQAFSCPPNFFDDLQLTETSWMCRRVIEEVRGRARELTAQTQAHAEWLQREWDAVKLRLEELSRQSGSLEVERDAERQRASQLEEESKSARERESSMQAHTEWLQKEWDAAKQRIEDFRERSGRLEAERDMERQRAAERQAELQAARELWEAARDQIGKLEQETRRLQGEWNSAEAKIHALNESSHHWSNVADERDRQLKAVYASYSWRIMARARALWHFGVRLLRLPFSLLLRLPSAPVQIGRTALLKAMDTILADPVVTKRTMNVLRKYPALRFFLRDVALSGGLINAGGEPIARSLSRGRDLGLDAVSAAAAETGSEVAPDVTPANLSPRAARIFSGLKHTAETGAR